ncbi:MAG TPA: HAD family phosphatase [Vicinamibacterales bacterium]|jgi:beta-phosphoglucomutase
MKQEGGSRVLEAVVFDFDGVLADTEPLHFSTIRATLEARGVPLSFEEYGERYLGYDDAGVFRAVARDRGLAWDAREIDALVQSKGQIFRRLAAETPVLFAGVAERLREWSAHVPMGIASGAFRDEIVMVLDSAGLSGMVRTIVGAGETTRHKPEPEPYLRALELLGPNLTPGRCVAIEDSPWGITSAREARMKVVALTTSCSSDRLFDAHHLVRSFEDLSLDLLNDVAARS